MLTKWQSDYFNYYTTTTTFIIIIIIIFTYTLPLLLITFATTTSTTTTSSSNKLYWHDIKHLLHIAKALLLRTTNCKSMKRILKNKRICLQSFTKWIIQSKISKIIKNKGI